MNLKEKLKEILKKNYGITSDAELLKELNDMESVDLGIFVTQINTEKTASEVIRAYSDHNLLVPAATDVQLNPFYKYHVEEVAVDLSENSGDIFKVGSVKTGKTDSNATVAEDQEKLWNNKNIQEALRKKGKKIINALDVIEAALLPGEKEKVLTTLDELCGYNTEEDKVNTAKNL